ncbi:MAG: hypothetical protein JXR83_22485 [Deltaproteobacteria bacterium]|nr:hypothetical protein [Deltaproteobacteria bacterium]
MPLALAEALRRAGEIDSVAIDAVARSPALRGRQFALRLYLSGLVSADVIFQTLLRLGARDATPRLSPLPAARLLALVPSRLAEEGCLVPFIRTGHRLHVAMLDPSEARTIEDLALFTGFAIEPFVAHARDLFRARYLAYGIPAPTPVARFVVESALVTSLLPPPPHDVIPAVATRAAASRSTLAPLRVATAQASEDESTLPSLFGPQPRSPLTASLAALDPDRIAAPAVDEPAARAEPASRPALGTIEQALPANRVDGWGQINLSPVHVSGWQPSPTAIGAGREALASQALNRLAALFKRVALFLVKRDLAVGWDAAGGSLTRQRIRDVLLPLEPPSTLRLAATSRAAVTGDVEQAESIDRMLLNFLGEPMPTQWQVVPVVTPLGVVGLLYTDLLGRPIEARERAEVDAVATELGRALHEQSQRPTG